MKRDLTLCINVKRASKNLEAHLQLSCGVVHPEFMTALKSALKKKSDLVWDPDGKAWQLDLKYTETVKKLAVEFFKWAFFYDGNLMINLTTGAKHEQLALF